MSNQPKELEVFKRVRIEKANPQSNITKGMTGMLTDLFEEFGVVELDEQYAAKAGYPATQVAITDLTAIDDSERPVVAEKLQEA